jgi:hypothetical protein
MAEDLDDHRRIFDACPDGSDKFKARPLDQKAAMTV